MLLASVNTHCHAVTKWAITGIFYVVQVFRGCPLKHSLYGETVACVFWGASFIIQWNNWLFWAVFEEWQPFTFTQQSICFQWGNDFFIPYLQHSSLEIWNLQTWMVKIMVAYFMQIFRLCETILFIWRLLRNGDSQGQVIFVGYAFYYVLQSWITPCSLNCHDMWHLIVDSLKLTISMMTFFFPF